MRVLNTCHQVRDRDRPTCLLLKVRCRDHLCVEKTINFNETSGRSQSTLRLHQRSSFARSNQLTSPIVSVKYICSLRQITNVKCPLWVVVITRSKLTLNHPNSAAAARTAHNVVFLFVSRLYGSSLISIVWSFVWAMFILVKLNFTFNFPFVALFLVRKSINYKGLARRAAAEHVSHGSFFIAIAAIMALRAMQCCQHLLVRASLICHLDSSSKKRPECWPNSFAAHLPGM